MRVLIQNFAPVGAREQAFFSRLIEGFNAQGAHCTVWTTADLTLPGADVMRSRWDLGAALPEGCCSEASMHAGLALIDVPTWEARLARLIKQSFVPAEVPTFVQRLAGVSHDLIERVQPDLLLAWCPLAVHAGVATQIARAHGAKVLLLERGLLPDTWFLEPGGLLGHSWFANIPMDAYVEPSDHERGRAFREQTQLTTFNRYAQQDATLALQQLGGDVRVAFFPPDDVSIGLYPSSHDDRHVTLPHFSSSLDASLALAGTCGATVAFKPHPSFQVLSAVQAPHNHHIVSGDFRQLIAWATVVAGTGSGLEAVALAMGKPVVVLAHEILRGKGVAYDIETPANLATAVHAAHETGQTAEQRNRFDTLMGWFLRDVLVSIASSFGGLSPERAAARACAYANAPAPISTPEAWLQLA